MSRPRVLVLTKTTALGGAERLLANALPHLDRRSFGYRLAACDAGGPLHVAWRETGLPFLRLPGRQPLDPRNLLALRRLLVRERIDLVHAHLPLPGVLARVAARGLPVRLVYTEHNVRAGYHPASWRLHAATYPWQHAVIAVSERVRQGAAAAVGPIAAERTTLVPNGLDLASLDREAALPVGRPAPPRPEGAFLVLVPATLATRKGQDVLLRAIDLLRARSSAPLHVWLAGDGPARRSLAARARRLGIAGQVHFLGVRRDVFALMRAADAVVLPSRCEGHPLALLEALALGRPVLATSVGGVPEIVRAERTGLLVRAQDPAALAAALARLRRDAGLRARLGAEAARDVRARFDVRTTVAATEAIYRASLGEDVARRRGAGARRTSGWPGASPRAWRGRPCRDRR